MSWEAGSFAIAVIALVYAIVADRKSRTRDDAIRKEARDAEAAREQSRLRHLQTQQRQARIQGVANRFREERLHRGAAYSLATFQEVGAATALEDDSEVREALAAVDKAEGASNLARLTEGVENVLELLRWSRAQSHNLSGGPSSVATAVRRMKSGQ